MDSSLSATPIDVIIPVYRNLEMTRRCVESVFSSRQLTEYDLIIVDDCSPDAELTEWLKVIQSAGKATVLRNDHNLGFVASVNRGMALHPDRDVVLLNSDTEVANDWLDRLRRSALSSCDIGTVTPFSNNATICSYPYESWTGEVPGTLGLAKLDMLFAETHKGVVIDLPTAVGFCMYIRRACLEAVGMFDVARFGRGYGEENDFCRRALAVGWRSVLAANIFVYHKGGVSFAEERESLQKSALKALLEVHPDYIDRVNEFVSRDPLSPFRHSIDNARAKLGAAEVEQMALEHAAHGNREFGKPTQLHISHTWGGGTGKWVSDFCKGDLERRNLLLCSRSDRNNAGCCIELLDVSVSDSPMAVWELTAPIGAATPHHPEYRAILREIIDRFEVGAILVSSLVGHALDVLETGLPTLVVMHDFFPFCPAMFAYYKAPCAQCSALTLESCLQDNSYNQFWHNTQVDDWMRLRQELNDRLRRPWVSLAFPALSVRDRWVGLFPSIEELPWRLVSHGVDCVRATAGAIHAEPVFTSTKIRIVIPGRLAPHKGLNLFQQVLPELLKLSEVLLLGCGEYGSQFMNTPGIDVIADYDSTGLVREIARFSPDCALFLSIVPESFSYTLSEIFCLCVPPVATHLGAFGDRIEHGVTGLLFEPEPEALLACLREIAQDRTILSRISANLESMPARTVCDMIQDYHALLPCEQPGSGRLMLRGMAQAAGSRQKLIQDNAWLWGEILRERDQHAQESGGLRRSISDLNHRLSMADASLAAMKGSRSWRVTAPVRNLARIVRRVAALIQRSRRAAFDVDVKAQTHVPRLRCKPGFIDHSVNDKLGIEVRHGLGIPDAARLVFCFAPGDDEARSVHRIIGACTAVRNDVFFLIFNDEARVVEWGGVAGEMAALKAQRRIFFVGPIPEADYWLRAAEALVVMSKHGDEIANALAAMKAGLFLISCQGAPNRLLNGSRQIGLFSDASPSAAANALSGWLDLTEEERAYVVAETTTLLSRDAD